VTLTLEDDIDISRGDLIARGALPAVSQDLDLMVCWLGEHPLQPNGKYALRHATRDARAMVRAIQHKVNINTLEQDETDRTIGPNDIARITVRTTQPLAIDSYRFNRQTGSLILIDEATNVTVGAGMIV
jgi:sulfate adenylyltransferase subunit 1